MKQDIKKGNFKTRVINSPEGELIVRVDIIQFIEDSICYVYCPALDLTGYGLNEAEAKQSFEITLLEYIKYTTNKKTFKKDLQSLGWKSIGKGKYAAPTLTDLINKEES